MKTYEVENARGNVRIRFQTISEAVDCAKNLANMGQNVMVTKRENAQTSCVMVYMGE